jgi:hypothetical protein
MNRRRPTLAALAALGLMLPAVPALAEEETAAIMAVEFAIQDYGTWRPVFDNAAAERQKAGVTDPRVFRDVDKPNQVLVLFSVATRKKGMVWMKSAQARDAWKAGGVIGTPTYHFLRPSAPTPR